MQDHEPTVRSRELGEGLRRAMEHAGLTGKQVAKLLDLSPSWVSRLVSGKRNVTAVQVSAFLAVCRAPSVTGCSGSARTSTPRAGSSSTAPGCPCSS